MSALIESEVPQDNPLYAISTNRYPQTLIGRYYGAQFVAQAGSRNASNQGSCSDEASLLSSIFAALHHRRMRPIHTIWRAQQSLHATSTVLLYSITQDKLQPASPRILADRTLSCPPCSMQVVRAML